MEEFINIYSQIQSDDKRKMSLRRCKLEEPKVILSLICVCWKSCIH